MTIDTLMNDVSVYNTGNKAVETQALLRQSQTQNEEELKQVCQEFENLFVKIMLDSMHNTLDEDGLIPKNSGAKLFEDRLYNEYARKIGNSASLGIADMMYQQMSSEIYGNSLDMQV